MTKRNKKKKKVEGVKEKRERKGVGRKERSHIFLSFLSLKLW